MYTKKHKLTGFSYELANIRPEYRSKNHMKQLLAVAKEKHVKSYGLERLLGNFFFDTAAAFSRNGIKHRRKE